MTGGIELLSDREGECIVLRSPEVGLFTCARQAGDLLAPRAVAGILHSLGRRFELLVPAGVAGRVINARPERVLAAVSYGTKLYELDPLGTPSEEGEELPSVSGPNTGALLFRAPYSGRFWHRPSPGDPPFVRAGDPLRNGQTLGLIEVMKTFTHLVYRSGGELPAESHIVRFVVPDGGEVKDGGALLELEPL